MGCKQVESSKNKNTEPIKANNIKQVVKNNEIVNNDNKKSNQPNTKIEVEEVEEIEPEGKPVKKYLIQFFFDSKNIWEKSYSETTIIETIFGDLIKELPGVNLIVTKWKINNIIEFDISQPLTDFLAYASDINEIRFYSESFGLVNFPGDLFDEFTEGAEYIGKLLFNPYSLLIFHKSQKSFELFPISTPIIEDSHLDEFSLNDSYCNGGNSLYLSCNDKNNKHQGHFWSINLQTQKITKTQKTMLPKSHHSMILIPYTYIFIIGGNTLDTFYYDTSKDSFVNWGNLHIERYEPSLSLVDNKYIYCFSYMKTNLSFERTILKADEHSWELINPIVNPKVEFTQKYFAIAQRTKEVLIFLGGCMVDGENNNEEKDRFMYNYTLNELKESHVKFKEYDFIEKTFLNINHKWSCLIPNCTLNDMSIIFYNNHTGIATDIHFEYEEGKKKISHHKKIPSFTESLISDVNRINLNMPKSLD